MLADATASGGAALRNPDAGQPKISPALAAPANYFERTFTAFHGVAYHLWVRLKAQNNSARQRFRARAVQRIGGLVRLARRG